MAKKTFYLIFLPFLLCSAVFAQKKQVTGTVTADGEPLPGVSVIVKNKNTGTVTDFEGAFSLKAESSDVIIFSYLGYDSKEVKVEGKTIINVSLEENQDVLDEVVLVGYGSQKKSDLTGAVSTISSKDIAKTPVTSIDQTLSGNTPGVYIANRGGDAGAPISVRIRGVGTIGNTQPLFVVDGVPLVNSSAQTINSSSSTEGNPLAAFNPSDIESISILKDASAAAIYGARGANGVVIIKTKRGRKGQGIKATYNVYSSISKRIRRYDVLNTEQYLDIQKEIGSTQFDLEPFRGKPTYDWQDAIINTGYTQNHNLSISGGGENSNFKMAAGYLDQKGITLSQGFKRYSFSMNSDFNVGKIFSFGESISIGRTERLVPSEPGDNTTLLAALNIPFAPIYDPTKPYGYAVMDRATVGDLANNLNEPIQLLGINDTRLNKTEVNTTRVLANGYAAVRLLPGLTYNLNAGADFSIGNSTIFGGTYNFGGNDGNKALNSLLVRARPLELTTNLSNTIKYEKTFDKHKLTLLAGHEATLYRYNKLRGQGNVLFNPNSVRLVNQSDNSTVTEEGDHWSLRGFLGRLTYNFDDRYLLTANLRRDATTRLSPKNRTDYFPSVAVGWNISNESFMEDNAIFDRLKLKASWGEVGNQYVANSFAWSRTVSTIPAYPIGSGNQTIVSAPTPINFANNTLRWERSKQSNIGIEAAFFNNKLNFSAEYYEKITDGILVAVPLPAIVGITNPVNVNLGVISNKGLEFSLGYSDNIGKFTYSAQGNFSTLKNNVESLGGNSITANVTSQTSSRTIEGSPIGEFFGYVTDGIYQTPEELADAPDDQIAFNSAGRAPGDIRFVDINGDGVINQSDRTGIGSPIPTYFYGFTLSGAYEGFDFSIFLQGLGGNKVYNYTRQQLESLSSITNKSTSVLNRWTGPGTSNDIPRIDIGNANNNDRFSNRWIESGAYTRIKNVSVGYNFNSDLISKASKNLLSNVRIYFAVQNLAVFTKYKGLDPEVTRPQSFSKGENSLITGVDDGYATPQPRTIQFGARITF